MLLNHNWPATVSEILTKSKFLQSGLVKVSQIKAKQNEDLQKRNQT